MAMMMMMMMIAMMMNNIQHNVPIMNQPLSPASRKPKEFTSAFT
jgi:hypothetical protein